MNPLCITTDEAADENMMVIPADGARVMIVLERGDHGRLLMLSWEQAQQLHLYLRDWTFQNRPNKSCPYPDTHHATCTCNGEGGGR